ncbi:hypothetical protein POL88_15590 [Priestia megaterium]|uniref:hypothetical protein n=1 Tax=Priestia megaterium TaxID=1404 RepID=UPI00234F8D68|nr:hypothetical protein [Priestia megaterium]MDC7770350.1 hypothetical protein [Priestia megaterium]
MKINDYLNKLEGKSGKRHVLLIVTPKGKYPNQFAEEYYELENEILAKPKSYMDLYEENEDEIMQYAAFRLFLKPIICDNYRLYDRSTTKVKRMNRDEIISFIVTKHFYDTVPSSEKTEEEAIKEGVVQAEVLLKQYPLENFEFASVKLGKDSDEANVFIKLDFKNESNNYYFDYVYIR